MEKGDSQGAKTLFQAVLERKSAESRVSNLEAAEAARNLGALAFYDNTKEALAAYRRAVELDYNNLGNVYQTRGDLGQAEVMHRKARAIDEALGRKEGMAGAYGNLGIVYRIRGDLVHLLLAEAAHKQALAINEALGRKEGMAYAYDNLGIVYQILGDLAQAEEMHKQSLTINEALGLKEGMAANYGNLGKCIGFAGAWRRPRRCTGNPLDYSVN